MVVRRWWKAEPHWPSVRAEVHQTYSHDNFTDEAANLAYTVLGWLAGEGGYGKSLCIATNCGADTDCTAATLGSLHSGKVERTHWQQDRPIASNRRSSYPADFGSTHPIDSASCRSVAGPSSKNRRCASTTSVLSRQFSGDSVA